MILVEETSPAQSALPVAGLRAHLRLGTGFDLHDSADEDRALAGFLRAAIATIEGRTGKVLLRRVYRMVLRDWRDEQAQPLPMAPVQSINSVEIHDGRGVVRVLDPSRYRLVADHMRPVLRPVAGALPSAGGQVVVRFTAGFSDSWDGVPGDLGLAVIMLAARYYEDRGEDGAYHALPLGVSALIERWRGVRMLAGRGAR